YSMDRYSTEYFMLLIVTWYLSQVLPSEYDKWHLVFSTLFRKLFGMGETKQDRRKSFLESGLWHIDPEEVRSEDDAVREERRRVLENEFLLDSPLVLKRIHKGYPNGKLDVKDVTFAVESNTIFVLLVLTVLVRIIGREGERGFTCLFT